MTRTIFSGIKPTGHLTLGNYLGALRRFAQSQDERSQGERSLSRSNDETPSQQDETIRLFSVVNLHALTVEHDPQRLRQLSREAATLYLAAGLDPERSILFLQSDVTAHTTLSYLMECTAYMGELSRMIQYKEKGRGRPMTRTSLFTYPALMAADILAYGTTDVPVGEDQTQHVELSRDLAHRFNRTYGEVFVLPRMMKAEVAARVMDLQEPRQKMSKEGADDAIGVIRLLDGPDLVRRKVMRAVTDTEGSVRYDREAKPGESNLLDILGACRDLTELDTLADQYVDYGGLKRDVAEAVINLLEPLQQRYAELVTSPGEVDKIMRTGAERAEAVAVPMIKKARQAIGVGDI